MRFHPDGKALLDHLYTEPDPRTYFGSLRALDYRIPGVAKPHFAVLIETLRAARTGITVLDIGCSYGINALLLRCDTTMDQLYERYADPAPRDVLVERDRSIVATRNRWPDTRFLGLDVSEPALRYAREAGLLEVALDADLESDDPTPAQALALSKTDLAISTGCIGYVTERTLDRVVRTADRPPWMAHFVLRMYPYAPIAQRLSELGYDTTLVGRPHRQRRFASAEEQAQVLDNLSGLGIDPTGLEADGWLYAELFISRPRGAAGAP